MARRCGGARCICTGSRSFTYGSLRSYENLMKKSSRVKPRPVLPNNTRVFEKPMYQAKG